MSDDPQAGGSAAAPPSTEKRLDTIEAEQARQGGVLDKLVSLVEGGKGSDGGQGAPPATGDPAPAADMTAQMREAVRAVRAEEAAAAAAAAHDADHATLRKPAPETPPREAIGRRAKIQRVLFGEDPAAAAAAKRT
jgi:hypothetical protein